MLVGLVRYRDLLVQLVATELRVKYRGSVLGFLWSLLNPLALIVVYSLAFRYIIRIQIDRYTVFLVAGLLPWQFFASSLAASTVSLMTNASLLKKVQFPREVLPVATVLFNLIQKVLALLVFLPSLLVLRDGVPWTVVFYPAVLALQTLFVIGAALALSALTVTFRDLRHLTEVALMMLFWLTPIVYAAAMVPPALQGLFALNPMVSFATAYQDIVYWGRPPAAATVAAMLAWAAASLAAGSVVFRRRAPYLAEEL